MRFAARRFVLSALALLAPVAIAPAAFAADVERAPEPTAAAQQEAEKLVKDVYKDDYLKRGPDERRALAAKLLDEGRNTRSDATSQYVLLREARDMATQVGDIETAMTAVNELGKLFTVDAVDMKLKALSALRTSTRTPEAQLTGAEAALAFVDEALAAENFDAASKAADIAISFATAGKNMQMVALVQARRPEIRAQQQASLESKIAADKLKQSPKDPDANHAVGQYLALFKNEWDKALPMLALSKDPAWSTAAKADLANPVDVAEMTKVADAWWDLAGRNPAVKNRLSARAEFWYNIILPNSDGLIRAKIEKRLEQIAAAKTGTAAGVTEETRRLLPTPTEMLKIRELAVAAKGGNNYQKREELYQFQNAIHQRLLTNVNLCTTADFFARCRADAQMRKVMLENGTQSNYGPIASTFSQFAATAKTKEDFGTRLVEFERFNLLEKVYDQVNLDSVVYSSVRSFVSNNIQQFNTQQTRLQLCAYLKNKGVKSPGLERYRAYVERTRTAY